MFAWTQFRMRMTCFKLNRLMVKNCVTVCAEIHATTVQQSYSNARVNPIVYKGIARKSRRRQHGTQNSEYSKRHFVSEHVSLSSTDHIVSYIKENTEISRNHMTPELQLHLVTPSCQLWTARAEDVHVPDPFWAFYWPGGQALSRYILDNPDLVKGKRVLDVGSGCGASAIAAALRGATEVTANDICPVAVQAIKLNSNLNGSILNLDSRNLIGEQISQCDVILLGDMFYDEEFTEMVASWLAAVNDDKIVLIGDPGRASFVTNEISTKIHKLAKYDLNAQCKLENNGLSHGYMWRYSTHK